MSLVQNDIIDGVRDKVGIAIDRLKQFEEAEGYFLAFSGGKDSVVLYDLAVRSGVKFDAHYSVTTIDPPELVRFIRDNYPDVNWKRPKEPFLRRLVKKGMPLRQKRWCCEEYKECSGDNRFVLTGIRWAESARRKQRKMVEVCTRRKGTRFLHPICDWSDAEVWEYIRKYDVPYCSLYDEGWRRIGCLFCPFSQADERLDQLKRYPGYEKSFRIAFRRLYADRMERNPKAVNRWKDGDEMFDWWIGVLPNNFGKEDDSGQECLRFDN